MTQNVDLFSVTTYRYRMKPKTKRCLKCHADKPLTDYHKRKRSKDGLQQWCKACHGKRVIAYQRCHPEIMRTRLRKWRAANPGKTAVASKRYRAKKYGLTLEEHENMMAQTRCEICGNEFDKLHTDHCHKTNKLRGMLCRGCNTGLGHFRDDPEILQAAIAYLQKHQP